MSNGKFFSGLPDSMLRGSSNRPDRMESQLFWPDESKTESVNNSNRTTPLKRATKPDVHDNKEFMEQNQADTPTPKEIFAQHQTSKIHFNDYADDADGGSGSGNNRSGVRNNNNYNNNRNNNKISAPPQQQQQQPSQAPVKNINVTNNYNNRMGYNDNSAKLNALKSNIGFYDYPDESRGSKATPIKTNQQQQDYNQSGQKNNSSVIKSRSDENVLKCKMNNDLYEFDKRVNNLNINTNNLNNQFSVNKSSRIIEETRSSSNGVGGGGDDSIPIKIRNETTHSTSHSSTAASYMQPQGQQYQNSHNVPISLDRDYTPGRSSRGCPQKSYNNITPLYSQQEQSPVIHAKSRAHDHLKSNIFFQNNSNNTAPPDSATRQHRPLSVRDSAVCRVGVGLPDM